jgi:hypothetical protein
MGLMGNAHGREIKPYLLGHFYQGPSGAGLAKHSKRSCPSLFLHVEPKFCWDFVIFSSIILHSTQYKTILKIKIKIIGCSCCAVANHCRQFLYLSSEIAYKSSKVAYYFGDIVYLYSEVAYNHNRVV